MTGLARRAVACKGWRWLPGMRDTNGDTVVSVKFTLPYVFCWPPPACSRSSAPTVALPDLTDPCTFGGLLSLVREAWGDPHVYAAPDGDDDPWVCHVRISEGCDGIEAPTEAEALVAALEAAGGGE